MKKAAADHYEDRIIDFLKMVWRKRAGYGFIGTKSNKSGAWRDHPVDLQSGLRDLRIIFEKFSREDNDLYFTPNTFIKPVRQKEFGLPTDLGWCDIDAADPQTFRPQPSILIETSPRRYQGLWRWNRYHAVAEAEAFSRALTYNHDGDRNGWSITKYMRLPYTFNYKPQYDRPLVRILKEDWRKISERPVLLKPKQSREKKRYDIEIDFDDMKPARSIVRKYWKKLKPYTRDLILSRKATKPDRSKQIYAIIASLHEAGASEQEIASCLWSNPYFLSKHGEDESKLEEELDRVLNKLI